MTKQRACEAKNPDTCRYHGTKIDANQYLPDHDSAYYRLAELNTESMGSVGRTRFRVLEEERRQAILDVDASEQGFAKLTRAVDTAEERLGKPDFFSEEKRRTASVHREKLLTDTAIKDFEGLAEDEYTPNVAQRLFAGTDAIVMQRGEVTIVGTHTFRALSGLEFDEYDLTNPLDRNRLVKRRKDFGGAIMNNTRFGLKDVRKDMAQLGAEADLEVNYRGYYAILRTNGIPYMRVEFQPDGTVSQGVVSGGPGYSQYIDSPIAVREYIYNVQRGQREANPIEEYLVA